MDYSLKEVAGRIRDLREAKGYTQEELAKLCGVSAEDYKVLEMGETDFSFTFIYKCAKACGVEVVDLLEGTSTTLTSFAITRKGEGLKIVKKHGVEYNNLAPKFREKLAEPFLVKFPYLEEEQNAPMSFEDMMAKFKAQSEDKMSDIKRSTDRRGGGSNGYRRGSK